MATKAAPSETTIVIDPIKTGTVRCAILGRTPLIFNAMSLKVKAGLIAPKGKKTAAQKAAEMKHDPLQEFRDSVYELYDPEAPTLLGLPNGTFKKAMMSAALDMPGAKKAQIGRLVPMEGGMVPVYGSPEVMCAVTRMADINKTPDVRTRCIVPRWAAIVDINFVIPILREQSVINLLSAAGTIAGVGDWRVEKGSGNYGQFDIVNPDDPEFVRILGIGRAEQQQAMANPVYHDSETRKLLEWHAEEVKRRGF